MKPLFENVALLLARLTLGLGFGLAGLDTVRKSLDPAANAFAVKFRPDWIPANIFEAYGKTLPWLELGIGALIILGLFTRIGGVLLFLLLTFHCITAFDATPSTGNAFLQAATLAAFGLVIALTGSGAWSLEARMGGGKGEKSSSEKPAKK